MVNLYFVLMLDSILTALSITLIASVVYLVVILIYTELEDEDIEKKRKHIKVSICIAIISSILLILTPSTKQVLIMLSSSEHVENTYQLSK